MQTRPIVYLSEKGEFPTSSSFNGIAFPVDLGLASKLKFDFLQDLIQRATQRNLSIFFHISGIDREDWGELASYQLAFRAFDEFLKSVKVSGVIFYEGYSEELFEFLKTLSSEFSEKIPLILLLDIAKEDFFLLDSLDPFSYGLKGDMQNNYPYAHLAFGWESNSASGYFGISEKKLLDLKKPKVGFGLSQGLTLTQMNQIEKILQKEPTKLFLLKNLQDHIQDLDRLIVFSESLSPYEKRLLEGFKAAGGTIDYVYLTTLLLNDTTGGRLLL